MADQLFFNHGETMGSAFDVFRERVVPGGTASMYANVNHRDALYAIRSPANDTEEEVDENESEEESEAEVESPISFEDDPRRYDLRSPNEAGGVWDGFAPEVGPTLRRGGKYVPLYPEPLEPELYKPFERTVVDGNTMFDNPTPQFDRPGPLDINNMSRGHILPGHEMWRKNNEGQGWATGEQMTDRSDQLTERFRPFVYRPQRAAPIDFREGGGDLAKHRPSADRVAPLGYFTPDDKEVVRDAGRDPHKTSSTAKGPRFNSKVRHPLKQAVTRAAMGGAHNTTENREAHREQNADTERRDFVFNPLKYSAPDRGTNAAKESQRGNALALRAYQDSNNVQYYGAPAGLAMSVGPGAPDRSDMRNIAVMKELTAADIRRTGNPFADALGGGMPAVHNVTDVFTTAFNQKLLAASSAVPVGQAMPLNGMPAVNNVLMPFTTAASLKQATAFGVAGDPHQATGGSLPAINNVLMPFTTESSLKNFAASHAVPVGAQGAYTQQGPNAYYNTEVFINPGAMKQATDMAYMGNMDGRIDPGSGAVRNTLMPFTNAQALKQAASHSLVGAPGNGAYGDPSIYASTVIPTAGDMIKVFGAREGISRPGAPLHAANTVTDDSINPQDIDPTNRTAYSGYTHAGNAGMSSFAPVSSQPKSLYEMQDPTAQAYGFPDPSLLSAFRDNPLVPNFRP
jgi:hypothetical protein